MHGQAEAFVVHGRPSAGGDLPRELDGETVGVVQAEGGLAPDHLAAGKLGFEQGHARAQACPEALFFARRHPGDKIGVGGQVGIGLAHDLHDGLDQARAHRLGRAQQARPEHGPANYPAQHVPAVLVGGEHPVRDQERKAPGMVGQHPQGHVDLGVVAVAPAGQLLGPGHERAQHVGLPQRRDVLQDRQQALETGAGVDARLGQGHEVARGLAVISLENEVPQFDEARLTAPHRPAAGAPFGASVIVQLRAWPARPGVAHFPEIVFSGPLYAAARDAHHVHPDVGRLVVVGVNRHPQAVTIEAQYLGQELPTPDDGFALEIITETEVPQHLEKRGVLGRTADLLDVVVLAPHPHALLRADGTAVRGDLLAQEVGDELVHARIGEQGRPRVVRNEPGRGDLNVAARHEEVHKGAAKPVGIHTPQRYCPGRPPPELGGGAPLRKGWPRPRPCRWGRRPGPG